MRNQCVCSTRVSIMFSCSFFAAFLMIDPIIITGTGNVKYFIGKRKI